MEKKKPTARILDPILDAEEVVWLGGEAGNVRKVYRIITTEYFRVGIAFFTPGEGGAVHVHENSEEFSYSLSGGGMALGENDTPLGEQSPGKIKWNPAGSFHGGKTGDDGISVKIWAYSAGGELPTNDGVLVKEGKV